MEGHLETMWTEIYVTGIPLYAMLRVTNIYMNKGDIGS